MRYSLAGSWLLFALSIIFLVTLTLFESALVSTSPVVERIVTFLLLVLPAAAGAGLGIWSLLRREGRPVLAIIGIALNGLFALFHSMLVLFAG